MPARSASSLEPSRTAAARPIAGCTAIPAGGIAPGPPLCRLTAGHRLQSGVRAAPYPRLLGRWHGFLLVPATQEEFPMRKATAARGLRGGPEPGTRRAAAVLAGCLLGALALTAAACGSGTTTAGGGTTSSTPAARGGTGTTAATTAVDTTVSSSLGTILVDSKGDTLYRLSKDSTDKSVCDAACAQ